MDQNNFPTSSAHASAATLSFEGELVVAHAEKIRGQLISAFEQNQTVLVDCSRATAADVSFVQIMIAAQRTAASWGKSVNFLPVSKAVETALEAGGFIRDPIPHGNDKAVAQQRVQS
jgi:ABC-type transporter Mla MlaB component